MDDRPLVAIEAEHGTLGAMMHKPSLCEEIGAFLDPSHFGEGDNAALYSAILACHSRGQTPDSITLSEVIPVLPSGEMTIIYASQIMRDVPSVSNAMVYAKTVKERHAARRLHEVGAELMRIACSRGKLADQYASAQSLVLELGAIGDGKEVFSLSEALDPFIEQMIDRRNGSTQIGLKFGMPDLDDIIAGCRPGNLVVIAGRPATGKTVLGLGLAETVSIKMKRSSLVFSLEMQKEELSKRTLASQSEVSQHLLDSGEAMDDEHNMACVKLACELMSRADLRICEVPALPFNRLCAIARFEHRARPLDVIVVDYIGLIGPDPAWGLINRNQELGRISRGLKSLAKELNIPIVALAQLNRGIEGRTDPKPKMSDLRDSGEIEQDADMIIIAHRDEKNVHGRNGITEIEVVKVRHAKAGSCLLRLQGDLARFIPSDLTYDQYKPQRDDSSSDEGSSRKFFPRKN